MKSLVCRDQLLRCLAIKGVPVALPIGTVRAAASTLAFNPASATNRTARASSSETTGIPAFSTETPTSESSSAIRSFSSGAKWTPGICSPSRSVSSHTSIERGIFRSFAVSEW